jgi:hypothetical protein
LQHGWWGWCLLHPKEGIGTSKELFDPTWLESKLGEIYKDLVIFKAFSCLLSVLHNNCRIDLLGGWIDHHMKFEFIIIYGVFASMWLYYFDTSICWGISHLYFTVAIEVFHTIGINEAHEKFLLICCESLVWLSYEKFGWERIRDKQKEKKMNMLLKIKNECKMR